MDDLKERQVMENFSLDKPDPAEFDMTFMIERQRDGLTNAQALAALIAHKRSVASFRAPALHDTGSAPRSAGRIQRS